MVVDSDRLKKQPHIGLSQFLRALCKSLAHGDRKHVQLLPGEASVTPLQSVLSVDNFLVQFGLLDVNSLPTVTPFSRPIVTPLVRQEWAYPRSAQEGPTRVAGAPHARGREARGRSLCTHVG